MVVKIHYCWLFILIKNNCKIYMGDKMSAFDRYYKKDKLVSRKFNIEEEIYNKLQYL